MIWLSTRTSNPPYQLIVYRRPAAHRNDQSEDLAMWFEESCCFLHRVWFLTYFDTIMSHLPRCRSHRRPQVQMLKALKTGATCKDRIYLRRVPNTYKMVSCYRDHIIRLDRWATRSNSDSLRAAYIHLASKKKINWSAYHSDMSAKLSILICQLFADALICSVNSTSTFFKIETVEAPQIKTLWSCQRNTLCVLKFFSLQIIKIESTLRELGSNPSKNWNTPIELNGCAKFVCYRLDNNTVISTQPELPPELNSWA